MARRALHLAVLWAFAVVAPLFDELGDHAEFFVARGNTATDILLVAFGLTLAPPLVLFLVELVAGRVWRPLGEAVHVGLVGLLIAVFAMGVLERAVPQTVPLLAGAGAAGAAGAAAYVRIDPVRAFLTVLGPAPAVFLAGLLLFSPVKEIVLPDAEAADGTGVRSDVPVVVAIFDELPTLSLMDRRGRVDAASFPSFGRLARTSTWYRNATTVADGTNLAVPSIFSGRRPTSTLPTARRYPDSIFTLLGDSHRLHVHEPITRVCPERLCGGERRAEPSARRFGALLSDLAVVEAHLLLPRGLTGGLPPVDRDFEDFGGQEDGVEVPVRRPARRAQRRIAGDDLFADRLRDAERFVRRVRRPGSRPPAYVAHFVVPHVPWRLLPSGRQYPVEGPTLPGSIDRVWTKDRFLVDQAVQRHLLQLGYADRLLGRLINRLKAVGVWDRALVVVAADHGVGLRPGGTRREISRDNFAAVAGVPLFVKRPGQRAGGIDDAPARTIDVLPTIASGLGVRDPPRFDGVALDGRSVARRAPIDELSVLGGRTEERTRLGFGDFVRARDAELARLRRRFPRGLRSVFSIGPGRRLLGRRVRTLDVGDSPMRVRINDAGAFARVDPSSGVVPVYVSGYFLGPKEGGLPLAVAVNGRIRAVARSYPVRDMTRFSALVAPDSLRRGRNTVEVFEVVGGRLLRLGRAPR